MNDDSEQYRHFGCSKNEVNKMTSNDASTILKDCIKSISALQNALDSGEYFESEIKQILMNSISACTAANNIAIIVIDKLMHVYVEEAHNK